MDKPSDIAMRFLAAVLLTAAVLKAWQLPAEPVANTDIWVYTVLLILTVEFGLALGTWLLFFHHHGYAGCAAAIPKYGQKGSRFSDSYEALSQRKNGNKKSGLRINRNINRFAIKCKGGVNYDRISRLLMGGVLTKRED